MFDLFADPAPDTFDPKVYSHDVRAQRMPPGQTLAKKFPHLEYASIQHTPDPYGWRFKLTGDVERAVSTQLDADLAWWLSQPVPRFPEEPNPPTPVTARQDFHCITGWSVLDTAWTGWRGVDLMALAGVKDDVTSVLVKGKDEFSTSLWLEDFAHGLIAFAYQGKPLSPAHGFPLRFVAPPHLYQFKSCKWVTEVEFLTDHRLGFWEIRAYSDSAEVWQNDRYANPEATTGKSMADLRAQLKREHGQ